MQQESYWLLEEFDIRITRNSMYSLRAFARDLNVSVSYLSSVFNGAINLNSNSVLRILNELNYDDERNKCIVDSYVENERFRDLTKNRIRKAIGLEDSHAKMKFLTIKDYKKIVGWEYSYIFSLVKKYGGNIDEFNEVVKEHSKVCLDKLSSVLDVLEGLGLISFESQKISPLFEGYYIKPTGEEIADVELWDQYLSSSKYIFDCFLGTKLSHEKEGLLDCGMVFESFNIPEDSFLAAERLLNAFHSECKSRFSSPTKRLDLQSVVNSHFYAVAINEGKS